MNYEAKLIFYVRMYKVDDDEKTVKVDYLDFKTNLKEKFRKVGECQIKESIETEILDNMDFVDLCLITVHCNESSEFEFIKVLMDLVVKYDAVMGLHRYHYEINNPSTGVKISGTVNKFTR